MENEVKPSTENVENISSKAETVETLETPSANVSPVASAAKGVGAFAAKIAALGTGPIIGIVAAVVVIIGAITVKAVTSTPKAIFKSTINNVYKEIANTLDNYDEFQEKFELKEKALYFSGDVSVDTNIEEISDAIDISKYKLGMELGLNPKRSEALLGVNISGDSKIDGQIYMNENNVYLTSSVIDSPVDITELIKEAGIRINFEEYFAALEQTSELNTKDYEYMLKTIKKALVDSLDSKKMKKKSAKMEVDGKKISTTKVSYEIDEDVLQATIEKICEDLLKNEEFLSKVSKEFDIDKDDLKEGLKELKKGAKDIETEDITINIYVSGLLNKVVGFDLEYDGDVMMSLYSGNKKVEMILGEGEQKIVFLAEEGKKEIEFTLKAMGEKIASGTIRSMDEKKIDFDFTIEQEEKISASVYLTKEEKKNTINGEYKFKMSVDEQYISVSGNYSLKAEDNLNGVDSDNAISLEEIDYDEVRDNIQESLKDDEELSEIFEDVIDEVEDDQIELNYDGMRTVNEDEAIELLSKDKATVLYVGDTYYSSSFEKEAADLFRNIKRAQNDFDFYSYYLNEEDVTSKFTKKTKDAPYSCEIEVLNPILNNQEEKDETPTTEGETTTDDDSQTPSSEVDNETDAEEDDTDSITPATLCKTYPVIYFIKDGKIVEALRSNATADDIEDALEAIGKK